MSLKVDLKDFHIRRARVKREALKSLHPPKVADAARDLAHSEGFLLEMKNGSPVKDRLAVFLTNVADARGVSDPTRWSEFSGRVLVLEERVAKEDGAGDA